MQLRNSPPLSQGDVRSARGSQCRVVSIKGSVVCSSLCLSFYFLPAWVPKAGRVPALSFTLSPAVLLKTLRTQDGSHVLGPTAH